MEKRLLGRSGIEISPMGLGCWAIGGQFYMDGKIDGYGDVDDKESIRAIHRALELGVNFIDTADAYGIGHSEKVIGEAIKNRRDKVIIATKFGFFGSEATKTLHGYNVEPEYVERACDASLSRLGTNYIDLYQLHVGEIGISELAAVTEVLDKLVEKGKIRTYGWSTDSPACARLMAENKNCTAIQQQLNIFEGSEEVLKICEEKNLASINRSPLAMGILSGKFNQDTVLPKNDVRGAGFSWTEHLFKDGRPNPIILQKLEQIREILTTNNRTLVQGALAYLWAKSTKTIPIPGFKNVKQAEENARAMEYGPLTPSQMEDIYSIINN